LGNPVQFVCLSGNGLTLSVCYTKENATVMAFFDVPTLGSSVSVFMLCLVDKYWLFMNALILQKWKKKSDNTTKKLIHSNSAMSFYCNRLQGFTGVNFPTASLKPEDTIM